MITRFDLDERVREWGLADHVVEKDYVLGWVLWGIGSDPVLSSAWAFKGGTCLKKCWLETFRFSEDLDFSVLPEGPIAPQDVLPLLERILRRVNEASGIDFSPRAPSLKPRFEGRAGEGRVYYTGPRGAPQAASVKLDLTAAELVVRPTVLRPIGHSYPDELPPPATVRCYDFAEVFAEKIRALAERCRPRDLYDVVHLYRRPDLGAQPGEVREILVEKCRHKDIDLPTAASIETSPWRAEIEAEWENMLAHQLPALPPFEEFWSEVPNLFAWLEERIRAETLAPHPMIGAGSSGWSPPPLAATWSRGIPLETVRFAGANRLCVELDYDGKTRLIEPYSLRESREGNLLLFARRVEDGELRSYRVDRIQGLRVTRRPFVPRFAIEFAPRGPLVAPQLAGRTPAAPRPTFRSSPARTGPRYVVECTSCGRRFERRKRELGLREHKDRNGWPCPGRQGFLADTRW